MTAAELISAIKDRVVETSIDKFSNKYYKLDNGVEISTGRKVIDVWRADGRKLAEISGPMKNVSLEIFLHQVFIQPAAEAILNG